MSNESNNEVARADDEGLDRTLSRRRALQLGATVAGAGFVVASTGGVAKAATGSGVVRSAAPVVGSVRTHTAVQPRRASGRQQTSFDLGWKFHRGDVSGADAANFDDRAWRTVNVPHDWSIEDLPYATSDDGAATADPSTMAFQTTPPPAGTPTVIGPFDQSSPYGSGNAYTVYGIGWYRKTFDVPPDWLTNDLRTELLFEGVFRDATIWLNGTQLGSHVYGYTPFSYDLTPLLVKGRNVVTVKVDNSATDAARWYAGSGIYRHTWLTLIGAVRVPDYGVFVTTPVVTGRQATVHATVEAINLGPYSENVSVRTTILDPAGRQVGAQKSAPLSHVPGTTRTFALDVAVNRPDLWSTSSPSMYQAQTELLVDGAVVDTVSTSFGIRSLVWDGDRGLLINGQQIKIRGACIHSNYGPLGAVALGRSVERQIQILKDAGFNSIRTAHNPPTPYELDVCDRLGMLVWDEAFDAWSGNKFTPDYVTDITTFIRRDRNHPSVIIWSTGNEVNNPVLGQQLHDIVHALDPTRPATQGATPFDSAADPQYAYTDVSDVHYDFTDKAAIRAKYPNRPMTQSESWPATIYDDWQFALDNSWFVGSWVWIGWDYMGESGAGATITAPPGSTKLPVFGTGPYPWFNDYQGDIDLIGQRKPQNYWRSVVYELSPIELFVERPAPAGTQQYANNWSYYDELQSWTWDVPAGQLMTVHVYTTGDSVTIRLNGKDFATNAVAAGDRRVATFQVPYQPGKLVATAQQAGRTIGSKTLATTGNPALIRLIPDVRKLTTNRDDLAHILAEVQDARGNLVPDAVAKLSFKVQGPGQLVGLGSGNPHNIDSFQRAHHYSWHGKVLAIVRPSTTPGVIRVTASASGLQSDSVDIPVRFERG